MTIKRYDLDQGHGYHPIAGMELYGYGDWVRFDDHDAEIAALRAKLAEAEKASAIWHRTWIEASVDRDRIRHERDAAIARAEKADAAYATLADGCVAIATERDAARASEARLRKVLNSIAFGEINATSADDAIDQVRDYAIRALAAEQEPKA